MDIATRKQIDAQLARRDAEIRRRQGMAGAFQDDVDDDEARPIFTARARRRRNYDMDDVDDVEEAVVSFQVTFTAACMYSLTYDAA